MATSLDTPQLATDAADSELATATTTTTKARRQRSLIPILASALKETNKRPPTCETPTGSRGLKRSLSLLASKYSVRLEQQAGRLFGNLRSARASRRLTIGGRALSLSRASLLNQMASESSNKMQQVDRAKRLSSSLTCLSAVKSNSAETSSISSELSTRQSKLTNRPTSATRTTSASDLSTLSSQPERDDQSGEQKMGTERPVTSLDGEITKGKQERANKNDTDSNNNNNNSKLNKPEIIKKQAPASSKSNKKLESSKAQTKQSNGINNQDRQNKKQNKQATKSLWHLR